MAQRLNRDQLYFQCLKAYERALAQLLIPFKNGTAQGHPCMPLLQQRALLTLDKDTREFFVKTRKARKEQFQNWR